jgi:hypothetical protein
MKAASPRKPFDANNDGQQALKCVSGPLAHAATVAAQ